MELFTFIASFLVAIALLLAPCASSHQEANLQKSLRQAHNAKFPLTSLPRKLIKLNEEVKPSADKNFMPLPPIKKPSSGTKQHEKEENAIDAAEKGTWAEEHPNKSEYFTMDYGWVRNRRPIHNKQIPFVP